MKNDKSLFSPFTRQCFVTASVGLNIVAHGAAIGYPAVLFPQLAKPHSELTLSSSASSWIASVIGITQLIGSLITPPIMGRCGRKVTHIVVLVAGLAGWTLTAAAGSFEVLLISRILLGLAIGLLAPLRSSLIGEYSSPKYRGALLTTISLTQTFGIFLVHLIGSILSWQLTAFIFMFFPFTSLVMTMYSPESPSWLAERGRYKECTEVFRWLRGDGEDDELEEMIKARIEDKVAKPGKRKLKNACSIIAKKEFYKPITLMIHAYILANFAGATVMASYSTVIIGEVMGKEANAHLWMIILDAQRLIFNSIAVFFINRYKRRTMMFSTLSLAIFSQLSIALYVFLKSEGILTSGIWLPAMLINLQFLSIATGILPLPNVIGGEVFPLEYRSVGATISLCFLSSTFFLSLKTFPGLMGSIGLHGTYMVHTGILIECMLVIWYLLPETKGKTLQQIEDEFRGKISTPDEEEMKVLPSKMDSRRRSSQRRCSSPVLLQ